MKWERNKDAHPMKNLSEHLLEDPLRFGVTRFRRQRVQEVLLAENVCQHGGLQTPRLISWSSLPNMLSVASRVQQAAAITASGVANTCAARLFRVLGEDFSK
jgi:hypothetical protein